MDRPPTRPSSRNWFALCLAALVLILSGAPCTGLALAATAQPAVSGPVDPCRSRHEAPPVAPACAQAACHAIADVPQGPAVAAPILSPAAYCLGSELRVGRSDPPPSPPPRPSMS